jgi:DNA-binding Lrp family transcriptional regulator
MKSRPFLFPEGLPNRLAELLYDLPLAAEPWTAIKGMGNVLEQVRILDEKGLIREIGPIFNPHLLGYRMTLAAGKVSDDRLEEVAKIISDHPGVSHNYLRDCEQFNLWFTLAVYGGDAELKNEIKKLSARSGISFRHFDSVKRYKISFRMDGKTLLPIEKTVRLNEFDPAMQKKMVMAIEILQKGVGLVVRPFLELTQGTHLTESELIDLAKQLKQSGIMRRLGVTWRHRELGLRENVLCVWQVSESEMDALGEKAAMIPMITHCYRRTISPDWPWPMYTMIHGRTMADCEAVIDALQRSFPGVKSLALRTLKEFKKTKIVYRIF